MAKVFIDNDLTRNSKLLDNGFPSIGSPELSFAIRLSKKCDLYCFFNNYPLPVSVCSFHFIILLSLNCSLSLKIKVWFLQGRRRRSVKKYHSWILNIKNKWAKKKHTHTPANSIAIKSLYILPREGKDYKILIFYFVHHQH